MAPLFPGYVPGKLDTFISVTGLCCEIVKSSMNTLVSLNFAIVTNKLVFSVSSYVCHNALYYR